jgi:hypothetical protein
MNKPASSSTRLRPQRWLPKLQLPSMTDRQSLDDYSRAGFSWFVEQFSRHRITHLTRSAFERLLR